MAVLVMPTSRRQEKRPLLTMLSRLDDSPRIDALPMFLQSFYTIFSDKILITVKYKSFNF